MKRKYGYSRRRFQREMRKGMRAAKALCHPWVIMHLSRCLRMIHHAPALCTLNENIFLTLANAYLQMGKTKLAEYFIKKYAMHGTNSRMKTFLPEFLSSACTRKVTLHDLNNTVGTRSYAEEIELLQTAISTCPEEAAIQHLNLAGYYASSSEFSQSIDQLHEAFKKGFREWDRILNDAFFREIIYTKEFVDLFLEYFPTNE